MTYCKKCGQKTLCGRPYCQHCLNTDPKLKLTHKNPKKAWAAWKKLS